MAKLYFKYGAMGSSKTAQALITKYNYEENGLQVWLLKPSADMRDGAQILRSRIGLEARVEIIGPSEDIYTCFRERKQGSCDVIIVDECQFLEPEQVDQLRAIVDDYNLPVMCFWPADGFPVPSVRRQPPPHGGGGYHSGNQNHLRLRGQGDGQRPGGCGRIHCDARAAASAGRQRQLRRHVPQVLGPGIRERRKMKLHGSGETLDS